MLMFIRANGLQYEASDKEIETIGLRLADRQASGVTREDVADWVRMIVRRAA